MNNQNVTSPNNNQSIENNVNEENNDDGNNVDNTLKPKFTDPEMFNIMDFQDNDASSIEVL